MSGLQWLQRKLRHLPDPLIYYEDIEPGGVYFSPWHEPQFDFGIEVPPSNGAIVISTRYQEDQEFSEGSTLAHEFRHHWQRWNGFEFSEASECSDHQDYDSFLKDYFRDPMERDALMFEGVMCPDPNNDHRLGLIGCDGQILSAGQLQTAQPQTKLPPQPKS